LASGGVVTTINAAVTMSNDMEKLRIAEHAAEWLIRLETATSEEREEFWRWLSQSPLHVSEMLAAQSCHVQLTQLFRDKHIDGEALVRSVHNVRHIAPGDEARTPQEASPSAHAPSGHTAPASRWKVALIGTKRARYATVAAACLIALLTAVTFLIKTAPDAIIRTGPGEWSTTTLDDGTTLRAGPRTRVLVEFTDERRVLQLSRGEILLHVAKNPDRPFVVETDFATARAVGTAFAVSFDHSKQIRVTVKEGIVAVARRARLGTRHAAQKEAARSSIVKAGEQILVRETGPLSAADVDVETALAWADGRLIFERETVEQAVQQFNRRNRVQLKVLDQALLNRAVRGVFAAMDPASFAAYLEKQGAVAQMDRKSETLLIASTRDRVETAIR
jgi:transmembrane sensor